MTTSLRPVSHAVVWQDDIAGFEGDMILKQQNTALITENDALAKENAALAHEISQTRARAPPPSQR